MIDKQIEITYNRKNKEKPQMDNVRLDNFIIVTATRYTNDDDRFLLAQNMVELATNEFHYPVLVIDDSDDPEIQRILTDKGAHVFKQGKLGFGNAVRQAIREGAQIAGRKGVIAWQEPEKIDMVRHYATLITPFIENRADMVIPKRTVKSLETYPIEQMWSERLLNRYSWLLSGKKFDFDLGSGARILKTFVAHTFTLYDGILWDALVVPIIRAARDGYNVVSVPVNYQHPPSQKLKEEGECAWYEKRLTQLQHLVPILKKEWGYYRVLYEHSTHDRE